MTFLCEQTGGKDIELSPTSINYFWIFDNLNPEKIEAISCEALRKIAIKGRAQHRSTGSQARIKNSGHSQPL